MMSAQARGRGSYGLLLACGAAVLAASTSVLAAPNSTWPASIATTQGFNDLGKAIANSQSFPRTGTDVDKAGYVFRQLPAIAKKYGLKPGSGSKLSDLVIGLYRKFGTDPENADSLKGKAGWGNCGEWTYAFSEVLDGAGVLSRVVFGDKSGQGGEFAGSFTGTDTTLYVEEVLTDGRTSRRVFDAFRAVYHGKDYVPTPETLRTWGNVPLQDTDKLARDQQISWQRNVGKPYVKDASTLEVLPPRPRRAPPMPDLSGWWSARLGNGKSFPVRFNPPSEDGKYSGVMYYQGYPTTTHPGHFSGVLNGKKLSYTWYNAEPTGGDGELRFDGGTLSGHWNDTRKHPGLTGKWSLTRMSSPPKGGH
jgi:hypothetical protein